MTPHQADIIALGETKNTPGYKLGLYLLDKLVLLLEAVRLCNASVFSACNIIRKIRFYVKSEFERII